MSLVFEGLVSALSSTPKIEGGPARDPDCARVARRVSRNYKAEAEYCSLCDIKGSYLPERRRRSV